MCPNIKNREIREKNKNKILIELFINGKPLKRKEIVKRTGIHEKTVSRCLKELEKEGIVNRVKKGYWALNEQNLSLKPLTPIQFLISQIRDLKQEEQTNYRSGYIKDNIQKIAFNLSRELIKSLLLVTDIYAISEFFEKYSILEYPIALLLLSKELADYLNQNKYVKKSILAEIYQDPSFRLIP